MLPLRTENQVTRIVNNIVKACKDIEKLSKVGYDYIYLASGFIAHYNINGFKDYYRGQNLRSDILRFRRENQGLNFRPGDENYEYYLQKAVIYNLICEKLV